MSKSFEQIKQDVRDSFSEEELYKTSPLKCPELQQTMLYKLIAGLPKGADLHAHGGALVPVNELIEFVSSRDDILIDTDPKHKGFLQLANKNPGATYMPLKQALNEGLVTKEELLGSWTLIGKPKTMDVWDWFQELFEKHNDLNEVGPTCTDYFRFSYDYYYKNYISHIEQRLFLKGSKEYAEQKAHCTYDAYLDTKKKYHDFTARVIPVGLKSPAFDMDVTQNIYDNTVLMHHELKDDGDDYIVGIDLVNEEDTSRPISDFSEMIEAVKEKAPGLNVNLHAGESKNKENNQIFEALELGTKRIGHGLNLWAHPELKKEIIEKDVCLEVCPISNQSLGFCDDLRKHPAKDYLKEGIPMVLCSDDPTYQENNTLTDDWFYATLAWDLSLEDLRKFATNSIKYSYLSDRIKAEKIERLDAEWDVILRGF